MIFNARSSTYEGIFDSGGNLLYFIHRAHLCSFSPSASYHKKMTDEQDHSKNEFFCLYVQQREYKDENAIDPTVASPS